MKNNILRLSVALCALILFACDDESGGDVSDMDASAAGGSAEMGMGGSHASETSALASQAAQRANLHKQPWGPQAEQRLEVKSDGAGPGSPPQHSQSGHSEHTDKKIG